MNTYCESSGQKINHDKSTISWAIAVRLLWRTLSWIWWGCIMKLGCCYALMLSRFRGPLNRLSLCISEGNILSLQKLGYWIFSKDRATVKWSLWRWRCCTYGRRAIASEMMYRLRLTLSWSCCIWPRLLPPTGVRPLLFHHIGLRRRKAWRSLALMQLVLFFVKNGGRCCDQVPQR
jgi:hypothetical protein